MNSDEICLMNLRRAPSSSAALSHEQLAEDQPANFVVMGDAACAFNPVYGQGMRIAALGALALRETLREETVMQRTKRAGESEFVGFAKCSYRLASNGRQPFYHSQSQPSPPRITEIFERKRSNNEEINV